MYLKRVFEFIFSNDDIEINSTTKT